MIDIKVPEVGESISEVTLVQWLKNDGDWVERDEVLCELESEKATFELNAEKAGILHIEAEEGTDLNIGDLACRIDDEAEAPEGVGDSDDEEEEATEEQKDTKSDKKDKADDKKEEKKSSDKKQSSAKSDAKATPIAKGMMAENNLKASDVKGTGEGGRILKKDVLAALENPGRLNGGEVSREDKREKMSKLRKTVSRRLVEAKNSTAMLTTFNEVDMTNIMAIRKQYKEVFKEQHGVNLGFMSFFTKACCYALMEWPAVNAYIDGEELIYHEYCDISIAVSAPKGLVVPVIRNAETLGMAEIEDKVKELATKARDNKLTIEEMTGGTFTITNGGVFGSLLSTPIINIPQSAILGMHKIEERPVAINGKVEVRPMMYLALSYDHRIIDGRESVSFLVRVKELLENPEQMLMGKDPVKSLLEL